MGIAVAESVPKSPFLPRQLKDRAKVPGGANWRTRNEDELNHFSRYEREDENRHVRNLLIVRDYWDD